MPVGFCAEFYDKFKEELIPMFLEFVHIVGTKRTLPNSLYEVTDTQITERCNKENY